MPREPTSARRARRLVTMALDTWGLGALVSDAEQIVSELVGNVIDHTRCRAVRVSVFQAGDRLVRISVYDRSLRVPKLKHACGSVEGGRGLVMVKALSRRWGYRRRAWGKIVWAELLVEARS
ncbi:ATP-binding protein [Streptomyces sp. TYQ1024]|nr:ATP-binding protein [Streptomyces sp. TYQ1024]